MKKVLFFLMIFLLVGCSSVNTEKSEKNTEKEKYELLHKRCLSLINDRYHIKYNLDTLKFFYTDDFNAVINSKYLLLDNYMINDIYSVNDSLYSIFVETPSYNMNTFYLDLLVDENGKNLIKQRLSDKAIFIFLLKSIKKINFNLQSFDTTDDEGQCDSYIKLNGLDYILLYSSFKGTAELIDVYYPIDFENINSNSTDNFNKKIDNDPLNLFD